MTCICFELIVSAQKGQGNCEIFADLRGLQLSIVKSSLDITQLNFGLRTLCLNEI